MRKSICQGSVWYIILTLDNMGAEHETTYIGDIGAEGKDQVLVVYPVGIELSEFQQDGQ